MQVHPRHLVEQAPVGGRPLDLGEALDPGAVVEGHHHEVTFPGQAAGVVAGGVR